MLTHYSQRFLVPPFVFFIQVTFIIFFNNGWSEAIVFLENSSNEKAIAIIIAFFSIGTVGVFAVGFTIGAAIAALQRLLSRIFSQPKGFGTNFNDESKTAIKDLFQVKNFNLEAEYIEQFMVAEQSQYLQEWIKRRWEYSVINVNCLGATSISLFILFKYGDTCFSWFFWLLIIFLLSFAVYLYNWLEARSEVFGMDNFIVRNMERFRSQKL